jgi:hygromycin-B 4-O-kinase
MGFGSRQLPVPRILEVGEAFGGYFAISERMTGDFIERLDGDRMRKLLPSLFGTLDAIRNVDVSGTSGFGVWGGDGHAPHASWRAALLDAADDRPTKRVHGWRERLAASPAGSQAFDDAFERLQTLIGVCPEDRHLIHSDLLYYNVLVANDRIAAVLDWGSSMYGDFLWDVAWFTFWQPWYSAWREIDFAAEAAGHFSSIDLDVPHMAERLRCYEICIGLDGLAYQAFARHWTNLDWTAHRLQHVLTAES